MGDGARGMNGLTAASSQPRNQEDDHLIFSLFLFSKSQNSMYCPYNFSQFPRITRKVLFTRRPQKCLGTERQASSLMLRLFPQFDSNGFLLWFYFLTHKPSGIFFLFFNYIYIKSLRLYFVDASVKYTWTVWTYIKNKSVYWGM